MNFWRASILPLVLAAAAFLGLCTPNAHAADVDAVFEQAEVACPTWFGWCAGADSPAPVTAEVQSEGEEDDCCSGIRKRTRKCWRPERMIGIALVQVKSPAEALRPCYGREHHTPPPAVSDILFIVGGYTRLFQKG